MFQVRRDLCSGCALCARSCPRQAISVISRQAKIDSNRCSECGICLNVCPQGAIVELPHVPNRELMATIAALRSRTDVIIARIDKLKDKQNEAGKERH